MKINSDFSKRVVVHSDRLKWQSSPIAGVERRMLDRIGDEVARATTIVKYAPQSKFSPHIHKGGEEFLVLDGIFQDEHGNYPPGSYIRNPPGSKHTPGSEDGCIIFVKLWQFNLQDRQEVRISPEEMSAISLKRKRITVTPLFKDEREEVRLEEWSPNIKVTIDAPEGAELLVLSGSFTDGKDELTVNSWLRIPTNNKIVAQTGDHGAKVWIKTGHLPFVSVPPS